MSTLEIFKEWNHRMMLRNLTEIKQEMDQRGFASLTITEIETRLPSPPAILTPLQQLASEYQWNVGYRVYCHKNLDGYGFWSQYVIEVTRNQ
jgi:hypothetical protein